ncbi:MAG: hypothetical protein EOM12_12765 [Verrucomicrobiae bacterium]|nr:hypothetical protein [Verrucomicrobiae bacterium]
MIMPMEDDKWHDCPQCGGTGVDSVSVTDLGDGWYYRATVRNLKYDGKCGYCHGTGHVTKRKLDAHEKAREDFIPGCKDKKACAFIQQTINAKE